MTILGMTVGTWVLGLILVFCAVFPVIWVFKDGKRLGYSFSAEALVLRIDGSGWSLNDRLVVSWSNLRTFEISRRKGRVIDSLVVYFDTEGRGTSTDFPFSAMSQGQAKRCLEAIKHHAPDIKDPWLKQWSRQG